MATVVLDAGHGGYDSGAVNGTRYEKNDNLRLTLAVGNILKNCGVNIIYTRSTDVFIPLTTRSEISNNAGADLFVSFHRNASTNPAANGVENWVYLTPSAKAVSAANEVLNRVVAAGVQNNRGIQNGNFSVLRLTRAPSMLLEMGFISNTEDNRLFDANFDGYANAIAQGILSSLGLTCGAPTPPAPPTTDFRAQIRAIQQRLNSQYGANLVTDGIWGPLSNRAMIRAFQTELNRMYGAGLVTDGIWGPATRAATRTVRMGDRNNLVWILQSMLYVYGFTTTPDGIFGPATDTQVRNFQRARGLTIDGLAGPATFEKLFTQTSGT